jgi:uncharacterized membrane protein YtjA (UPF0391 family)
MYPAILAVGAALSQRILSTRRPHRAMLRFSILFLLIAIVAGIFGFSGIYDAATDIARVLFFIFIVLFVVGIALGKRKL